MDVISCTIKQASKISNKGFVLLKHKICIKCPFAIKVFLNICPFFLKFVLLLHWQTFSAVAATLLRLVHFQKIGKTFFFYAFNEKPKNACENMKILCSYIMVGSLGECNNLGWLLQEAVSRNSITGSKQILSKNVFFVLRTSWIQKV